jgi:hypothetical protein
MYEFLLSFYEKIMSCSLYWAGCCFLHLDGVSHFLLDLFSRVSPRALVLKLKSQHSLKVLVHVCFFFAAWFSQSLGSGGMFFPVVQQVANSDFSFLPRLHFLAELTDPVSKVLSWFSFPAVSSSLIFFDLVQGPGIFSVLHEVCFVFVRFPRRQFLCWFFLSRLGSAAGNFSCASFVRLVLFFSVCLKPVLLVLIWAWRSGLDLSWSISCSSSDVSPLQLFLPVVKSFFVDSRAAGPTSSSQFSFRSQLLLPSVRLA